MKSKVILFILLLALVAFWPIVFLIAFSCDGTQNPTDENIRESIKKSFQINVPQEWESTYYNPGTLGGWHSDGTAYYVFEVTERDGEFFREFSDIKNEDFEENVINVKQAVFDNKSPIPQEYLYDFSQPYEWFFKDIEDKQKKIRIIYQSQKLYIFALY